MRATREDSGKVTSFDRRGLAGGVRPNIGAHSHYSTLPPGVKPERTNWRDQAISARHRLYGHDCPMIDLDFVACEYASGRPCALIEYKCARPWQIDLEHPSYRALRHLADAARIPALVVFYNPRTWSFTACLLNDYAADWFTDAETLSELAYVRRLYLLRGSELPAELEGVLSEVTP